MCRVEWYTHTHTHDIYLYVLVICVLTLKKIYWVNRVDFHTSSVDENVKALWRLKRYSTGWGSNFPPCLINGLGRTSLVRYGRHSRCSSNEKLPLSMPLMFMFFLRCLARVPFCCLISDISPSLIDYRHCLWKSKIYHWFTTPVRSTQQLFFHY